MKYQNNENIRAILKASEQLMLHSCMRRSLPAANRKLWSNFHIVEGLIYRQIILAWDWMVKQEKDTVALLAPIHPQTRLAT